jgi:toxin ParE1/3/4
VNSLPVQFHPAAFAELVQTASRYDDELAGLGAEFTEEVDRLLRRLHLYPELGTPSSQDTRRLLLRRFPYMLVYRIRDSDVVVLAVAHQRKRPGYWVRRR